MATSPTSYPVLSIELPTGVRLEYVEHGDAKGVPMVMLHGLSDSWRSFEPVLPHLPETVHAFAPSLRGHGDSARPLDGYATEDLAADVVAFMDAVGLASAIVAGHSMGATVAARVALDHPGRVDGIVLLAGARWFAPLLEDIREYVAAMTDPVEIGFVIDFQESTVAQPVPRELMDTAVAQSLKLPARVWQSVWDGTILDDQTGQLGRIGAPALLVWGGGEQLVPPAEQAEVAAAIPDARSLVYPGVGHALHWERPDVVAADLAAFAGQLQSVT